MIAATPTWVGDTTAWATMFVALGAALALLWKPAKRTLRTIIEETVAPLAAQITTVASDLREHMRHEENVARETADRLDRGAAALERLADQGEQHGRRLGELEETVADHIGNPNAHGLPRVPRN